MTAEEARAHTQTWIDGQYERVIHAITEGVKTASCWSVHWDPALTGENLTEDTIKRLEANGYTVDYHSVPIEIAMRARLSTRRWWSIHYGPKAPPVTTQVTDTPSKQWYKRLIHRLTGTR